MCFHLPYYGVDRSGCVKSPSSSSTHPPSQPPVRLRRRFFPHLWNYYFLDDTRGACMHHSRDCPFERNTISEAAIWSTRVLFFVVVCATKCQMFAFLTRARWRGWMLGSRTTSELRFAEIFSVDRTQKRSAGMRRIRRERRCSVSGRLTISIWWKAGRSLRAVTTGCKTTTHRNFIAGSLTADREALPETATGWITTAVTGRRVSNQAKTVRRKGVQKMQVRAVIFLVLIGFIWASRRCSSCVCVCVVQPPSYFELLLKVKLCGKFSENQKHAILLMHTVSSSGSWSHKCVWWLLKMYSTRQHPDNFFCVCFPPRPFTTDSCSTECLTKRSRSRDGGDDDDKSDGAGSQTIRAAEERPGRLEVWAVLQRANSARLGVSVCTNNPACYLCVMSCKHSVSEYDWSTLYCVCVWITAFFHCTIQQPRFLFMSHRAERRDLLLMEYCSFFLIIWQRGEIFF